MRYRTLSTAVASFNLIVASAYGAGTVTQASRLPDTLPTDRDAIVELLSHLTDADVRELLRRQLEHGIVAHRAPLGTVAASANLVGNFDEALGLIRGRLAEMLSAWPRLPSIATGVQDWLSMGRSVWQPLIAIAFAAAVLAVAFLVERLVLRVFRTRAPRLTRIGSSDTLAGGLAEAIFGSLRIAIFCAAALVCFIALYQGHEPSRQIVLGILGVVVAARLTVVVSHLLIQPAGRGSSWLLLPPTIAPLLHRRLVGLGIIAGGAYVSAGIVRAAGIEVALINLFDLLLAIILCGWIIATILAVRSRTRSSSDELEVSLGNTQLAAAFRSTWHISASCYVIAVFVAGYVTVLLGRTGVLFDVLGALFVPVGVAIADIELKRWFKNAGSSVGAPQPSAANLVLHRFLRALIYVLGATLVLRLIGFDVVTIASESLGGPASTALFSICITMLLAFVVWEIARMAIDREIAKEKIALSPADEGAAAGGASTASRLRTLLPLLRRAILATIAVITTMIVLTSLGVNIGPLLAGAGVVGLALGFGAQAVVRDMLSGIFFLAEDAFRLGEYVEVGNIRGTVEGIAIRSLKLRHHRGAVHTLPFGQIPRITNYSRDWVIQKLTFHLPFDTDLGKVKRIVKRIGADLLQEPDLGPYFLQPLKMQGVRDMTHDSMIVGVKFMARADDGQFVLRREIYKRIRDAFAENGIEFARPQVVVHSSAGASPPETAAAATAGVVAQLPAKSGA